MHLDILVSSIVTVPVALVHQLAAQVHLNLYGKQNRPQALQEDQDEILHAQGEGKNESSQARQLGLLDAVHLAATKFLASH